LEPVVLELLLILFCPLKEDLQLLHVLLQLVVEEVVIILTLLIQLVNVAETVDLVVEVQDRFVVEQEVVTHLQQVPLKEIMVELVVRPLIHQALEVLVVVEVEPEEQVLMEQMVAVEMVEMDQPIPLQEVL
jgi:cyanate lyase